MGKQVAQAKRLATLTASREAEQVQAAIQERYGFEPTLDYCRDLIAFVDAAQEPQGAQPHGK